MLYIEVEVRSSLIFFTIVILGVAVAALEIGDVLIYSLVPFFLYMVHRLISRFAAYKALFALITVLTIRGVISLVRGVVLSIRGVVLSVSIE